MSPGQTCPACGAALETSSAQACPFCGVALSAPASAALDEVRDLAQRGMKIDAIKRYRSLTQTGLAEAKAAVEALEAGLPLPNPVSPTDGDDWVAEVKRLTRAGKKIAAIKLYREATQVGLAEAKDAVEAIEAGQPLVIPATPEGVEPALSHRFGNSAELMDEVKRLLRQGNKIGAIKIYREYFQVGLAEAKTAVEQVETDLKNAGAPVIPGPPQASAFARPTEPTLSANPFDEPEKPSGMRRWLVGCSLALLLCLCLSLAIPAILMLFGITAFWQ